MKFPIFITALSLLSTASTAVLAASAHQRVEVAFVIDTTGSMADLIDGAKKKIWSIASTIVDTNPDAEIAMSLVAYRDRGDDYVVKSEALSEDIQGLYSKLIKLEADGGGDTPESVNEALDKAVGGLQWTRGDNVKHIVFLVGDAPPHMDYEQERQYPKILQMAYDKHIIVNAVQAGDMAETTPVWKEIAQFGHGRYIAIPQSGGQISIIITPYDDEILQVQKLLDESVLPYGDESRKHETSVRMAEKAASSDSVKIDNSKYYSKRTVTREVITGGGDLVSDLENKKIELGAINEEELPAAIKAKPLAERGAFLAGKLKQRQDLEAKMAILIAKRDKFALAEAKKNPSTASVDSFDRAIEGSLKEQLR